ncbi:hypothetical protein PGT21_003422 [Puccinia graminis f. sp. tritici]|uniref:No apical meristem-associated C-terminal domain-containing protein n=1 Tax=Puccinia graminis f. sp. tritici TaxID=56615 RepID=A0A5B0Q9H0_PUCGR|nr:hypothetical protein PGT21_001949 [Puccinia graminis f. sp. tritici]KAA1109926.1 hypothetical protein PGT21_003422 [Puccinia graminis f. sp. tritici]KAA1127799.1 hypothetical protein PGTUg99_002597 [Puccinia graminis f. sp. tritici]
MAPLDPMLAALSTVPANMNLARNPDTHGRLGDIPNQTGVEDSNQSLGNNSNQPRGNDEEPKETKKRSKSSHYQEQEDVELCKAWISITEDSRIGSDQSAATFWGRIHKIYCK